MRNLEVINTSGSLTLNVTGCNIHDTGAAQGDDGILVENQSTANITSIIANNTFSRHGGDHFNGSLTGSGTVSYVVTNNVMTGGHAIGLGQGIFVLGATFNGTLTYNISSNSITGNNQGGAIHVNKGSGTATFSGRIFYNVIGNPAVDFSGSQQGSGIDVEAHGTSGTHTTLVASNSVHRYNNDGILFLAGEGNPAFNITCTNNLVSTPNSGITSLHGIQFNIGTLPGETIQACINVQGNNLTNAGAEANGGVDLRMRQRQSSTVRLPGYGGTAYDNTAVQTYLTGRNTLTTVLASSSVSGAGYLNTAGGVPCTQP